MGKGNGLRIIAGDLKGSKIRTIPGEGTRPMTDRVRESLFNILALELPGAAFLDLFSGSGAVGIEALSRGAATVVFVESDPAWADVIVDNLVRLGLRDRSLIMRSDAYVSVESLARGEKRFGVVFAGPPYDHDHHNRIVETIARAGIGDEGTIVLQYRATDDLLLPTGYDADTRIYGITALSFVRRADA